jgi:hypothetical protein
MRRLRLDDQVVSFAERGLQSRVLWDEEVWGFGCRVPPSGDPAYVAYFRTSRGSRRVVEIGRYGALTCEQARGIAREVIGRNDPAGHKRGRPHESLARQIRAI